MRKLVLVLAIGLFGCQKEVVTKQPVKDCNCDRIVNVVRAKYDYAGHQKYWATITTVNDCSNWQKQYEYESNYSVYYKKEGECY